MPDEYSEPAVAHFHGFWPVLLIGISFILILVWEIQVAVSTRHSTEQLRDQQLHVVDQAKRVEDSLEKIARGLVDLSKTDDTAKQLVKKFGVKITNPSLPTETPTP